MNCMKGKIPKKTPNNAVLYERERSGLKSFWEEFKNRGAKIGKTMVAPKLSTAKVKKIEKREVFCVTFVLSI